MPSSASFLRRANLTLWLGQRHGTAFPQKPRRNVGMFLLCFRIFQAEFRCKNRMCTSLAKTEAYSKTHESDHTRRAVSGTSFSQLCALTERSGRVFSVWNTTQ